MKISQVCGDTLVLLNLEMCIRVTNNGIKSLANCPNLEVLKLRNLGNVDDEGMIDIAKSCTKLHTLNMAGLHLIQDSTILTISQSCKALERISLVGLKHITDKSVQYLLANCTELEQVDLNNCPHISTEMKVKLGQKDVSNKTQNELRW
jgi:hypothetical protein